MSVQTQLEHWAASVGLRHVLAAEGLEGPQGQLAALLVGSVATGFCREGSDVDIALVCDPPTYARISRGKTWSQGRPSEARVGRQSLHYYAETFDQVLARAKMLDDACLYVYGTAKVLYDPEGLFGSVISPVIGGSGLRKERLEGKLDMLLRRTHALAGAAEQQAHALVLAKMSLEVICLALKVVALIDGVPFDPRKRLAETALVGPLGQVMAADVAELVQISSQWQPRNQAFIDRLRALGHTLSRSAAEAGFVVGLPSPDPRAQEQL
ncbi:MAG: nucleotidyltransferase domain-containing protein [Phycisphaerae bacterium]|nr:nucleotidyltransferase domain-containing protein [Phycisphaerae bacterium]